MIELGVNTEMLIHFPADFFPQAVTQSCSAKTQSLAERSATSHPAPPAAGPCTPPLHFWLQVGFAASSCQVRSEGSKKWWVMGQWGFNSQTYMPAVRTQFAWVRHTLITRSPKSQKTPTKTLLFSAGQANDQNSWCKYGTLSFGGAATYRSHITAKCSFPTLTRWVGSHLIKCKPGANLAQFAHHHCLQFIEKNLILSEERQ